MSFVSMQVRILGKDYNVKCPVGQEKSLLSAAAEVERRMKLMRQTAKSGSSSETMAVITAINMAYELQSNMAQQAVAKDPAEQELIEQLHSKLDLLHTFNDMH